MAHAYQSRTRVLDIKWVSLADFSGFVCEVEHNLLNANVKLSAVCHVRHHQDAQPCTLVPSGGH